MSMYLYTPSLLNGYHITAISFLLFLTTRTYGFSLPARTNVDVQLFSQINDNSNENDALALIQRVKKWNSLSMDLKKDVASLMVPMEEVGDGHIFVKEGELITKMIIMETGKLRRTKLSVPEEEKEKLLSMNEVDMIMEKSIVIDEVTGVGTITNNLACFDTYPLSYVTVVSSGPSTKVWTIDFEQFRSLLVSKPEYSLNAMSYLASQLRTNTRNISLLQEKVKKKGKLIKEIRQGVKEEEESNTNTIQCLAYDATSWVIENFTPAIEQFNVENTVQINIEYTKERLSEKTVTLAAGYDVVCLFVNDMASADTLSALSSLGVTMICNRCAGFDGIDIRAALAHGITCARVPAYSPHAVAEMAVSLLMGVNRKLAKASSRVRMANFSLDGGLMGVDIHGKTVGVMGTGKIGQILCRIIHGFGVSKLLCYNRSRVKVIEEEMGGTFVDTKEEIFQQCDVIFLMMPLDKDTKHTIHKDMLQSLKPGVIVINTGRGGLVDAEAVLQGIQKGIISGYGADVYENEREYFFQDWSARSIPDPTLVNLLGNNQVLLTAHQAFFTQEAVDAIVDTTLNNIKLFSEGITMYDHPNNFLPDRDES